MVINVHAGHNPHGKVACGAVGLISESLENRRVKDLVVDELRRMGHTVYDCTVENGLTQSDVLTKIVKKSNAHTVDFDLSIHFNASSSAAANGAEVWVYNDKSKAVDKATDILNAICSLGFKNRGVKKSEKLYFLRKTKAPAVIIECCFVSSEKMYRYTTLRKWRRLLFMGSLVQGALARTKRKKHCRKMKRTFQKL